MNFSRLIIRNFRSIGPEGIEVEFSQQENIAAIVGANASGKTNLLTSIGIVLGVYPFSRFSAEETDFFDKNTDAELLIELHLCPPIIDHDVYRKEFTIAGFRYRVARYERGDRKGALRAEHYCFDDSGKTLVKPARIFRRKGQPDDGVDNTPKPILVSDQAWKLGSLFYLDSPTLERFFDKTTGWSPLGRLFEIYRDDFDADHNEYAPDDKTRMPTREAFEKFSRRLADILRTQKLYEIENGLSARIREYLGAGSNHPIRVEFSLPTHRELFERWVSLQISEHQESPSLPVERLGTGHRALLRLAVLETLLAMQESEGKFILLVEEPEMYLHVHLRRYFYQVLRRLAGKGHQIVYTTHAPEFLDLGNPQEIIRLHRPVGNSTISKQVSSETQVDFDRVRQKVHRMGNEELAFANHAILTEGQDDQGVIRDLLLRKGINPDIHSISIVNCDGVGQIKDYVKLCSELGIDFYVIHDRDDEAKPEIANRNGTIKDVVGKTALSKPSLSIYEPTLEATMGTEKRRGNLDHLLTILGDREYNAISMDYPNLVKPIDEFVHTRGFVQEPASTQEDQRAE